MCPIVVSEGSSWPRDCLRDDLFYKHLHKCDALFCSLTGNKLIEHDAAGRPRVGYNWAGFIRVRDREVYVGPKCLLGSDDITAWSRSLPAFLESCRSLDSSDVLITGNGLFSQSNTLLPWWADYYSKLLHKALHAAPFHRYENTRRRLDYVRGHIEWDRQYSELALGGTKVCCSYRNYQADNPLNQLLKWAAGRFMGMASSRATRSRLEACITLMSTVSDNPPEISVINRVNLPLSYVTYREPFEIAMKLYTNLYPNLWSGRIPSCGVMVNMVRAFEAFVDGVVHRAVKQAKNSGRRWFCSTQEQRLLATPLDGSGGSFYTRPDNQVWEVGIVDDLKRGCVIDAKYKGSASKNRYERPYSQDFYQVLTSCLSRGWREGLILSPVVSGEQNGLTRWRTSIPTKSKGEDLNVTIGLMKLNLMNLALPDGISEMTKEIRSYLEASLSSSDKYAYAGQV